MKHDVKKIAAQFQIDGQYIAAEPYGTGHINDTYASNYKMDDEEVRFIHQRINQNIFKNPPELMDNVDRVTRYQREKIIAAGGNPDRESLTLIPTTDDKIFLTDDDGNFWRTYLFITGAKTYDVVENIDHVFNAAKAFGQFQKLLADLPGDRLHETIPNFHNTKLRFGAFLEAIKQDPKSRACEVKKEIDFFLARQEDASLLVNLLEAGKIPERVTHNDTKFNNVMIDDETDEGICVIDLDTTMPGLAGYDFGDLVRTGANPGLEDEKDLSKIWLDVDMFTRITHGYLEASRDFLTDVEIQHLVFSGKLMMFENGMRFLTDHLLGDPYYKVHREGHNLDRTRTQIKLVQDTESKMDELQAIVAKFAK